MSPEVLAVYIKLQELITIREGMIAENTQRAQSDHSVAYDDVAFQGIADQIAKLLEESF